MALYTYECKKCGEFDVRHGINEPDVSVCPKCGTSGLIKVVNGGTNFILKGSGFYVNDYKKKETGHSHASGSCNCGGTCGSACKCN
ncbi:MAG: FmdB family zinc ribbon protein [bacterium]